MREDAATTEEEEGTEEEAINAIPLEEILPTLLVASVVKKAIGAMNALTLQITATNVEKKVIFPASAPREGLTSALVVAKKAIKRESAPTNQSLIAIIAVKRDMVLENVLRILAQVEEIEVGAFRQMVEGSLQEEDEEIQEVDEEIQEVGEEIHEASAEEHQEVDSERASK